MYHMAELTHRKKLEQAECVEHCKVGKTYACRLSVKGKKYIRKKWNRIPFHNE